MLHFSVLRMLKYSIHGDSLYGGVGGVGKTSLGLAAAVFEASHLLFQ